MQNPKMKGRRRELRKESTEAEKKLWEILKDYRWRGLPFRRQCSAGWYILDFYCPKIRLAIEVDGPIHEKPTVRENDRVRDAWLKAQGIMTLRISNDMVFGDLPSVIRLIKSYIKDSPSP